MSHYNNAGNQTTIRIEIPLGGECFTAMGLMIIDRGWLTVYAKYEVHHTSAHHTMPYHTTSHHIESQHITS